MESLGNGEFIFGSRSSMTLTNWLQLENRKFRFHGPNVEVRVVEYGESHKKKKNNL